MEDTVIVTKKKIAPAADVSGDTEQTVTLPVNSLLKICRDEYFPDLINYSSNMESRRKLNAIVDGFIAQDVHPGDADDFHNLAVELARYDEYALASKILKCGLGYFPKSADLLADFLEYGSKSNRLKECSQYFDTMMALPKMFWTWRSYIFGVNYLLELLPTRKPEQLDSCIKTLFDIIDEYKTAMPDDEIGYFEQSVVYRTINRPADEEKTLETAMKSVKICPRCAMRYAEIKLLKGDYDRAVQAITRGINDAVQAQSSVRSPYVYYLSGLSKLAVFLRDGTSPNEAQAEDIYSDFNIALSCNLSEQEYIRIIKEKTIAIVNKYGYPVPARFDRLTDCIG